MILGNNEWRSLKYRRPVRLFAETAEDKANWTRHKNIKYKSRSVYAWYHLEILFRDIIHKSSQDLNTEH